MEEQVKEMIRKSEKYWIKYKPITFDKTENKIIRKKRMFHKKKNINNEQIDCIWIIRIDNMQKTDVDQITKLKFDNHLLAQ